MVRRGLLVALALASVLAAALPSVALAGPPVAAAPPAALSGLPFTADAPSECRLTSTRRAVDLTEAATDLRYNLRAAGPYKVVVLFVDFSDAPATGGIPALMKNLEPAESWFRTTSYGKVSIDLTPLNRWLRMPRRATQYRMDTFPITFDTHRRYISEALLKANRYVDFRDYDMFWIVPSSGARIAANFAFLATPGYGVKVDGIEVRFGATFEPSTHSSEGWRTAIHETSHIFGLPDLYDYEFTTDWVGPWDPMSASWDADEYLGWHKWKLGWFSTTNVVCLATGGKRDVVLTPFSTKTGPKIVVMKLDEATAIVAELREDIGWDGEPCTSGILVYKVLANQRGGAGPVRVLPAARGGSGADRCGGALYRAPFQVGGTRSTYDGGALGVTIVVDRATSSGGILVHVTKTK